MINRHRQRLSRAVALLAAGLAAACALADTSDVGPVVNPANGHTYHAVDAFMTWAEADAWSASLGGHLVVINDAGEDAWLRNHLGLGGGYYWLGAHDAAAEGSFAWVTGEPFLYTNFLAGEPDDDAGLGGGGDYLALSAVDWQWLDTNGQFAGFVTGAIAEIAAVSAVDPDPSAGAGIRFEARPTVTDSHTRLHFTLPRAAAVDCRVFDVRGRLVRKIAAGEFGAGAHELAWDVRDDLARRVHSGTYLVALRVDGASRIVKVAITH